MNHDRKEMLEALELIKPALATKDLIEELSHVWFDGEHVMAYNDADLGIQAPFKSPFKGGIRGALLLGLIHNSRAKEVIFEEQKEPGVILMKAARAKVKLATLDPERAVWQFPVMGKKQFQIDDKFIAALKAVLVAVGNDTSIPEKMGVTCIFDEHEIAMFTTDSKTMARALLPYPKGDKPKAGTRMILPTAFCEQLLRLCGKGGKLDIQKNCAIASNDAGVLLYARIIESEKPLDFDGVYEKHKPDKKALQEIPKLLSLALERTLTMLDGQPGTAINMRISEGKLHLEVLGADSGGRGELKDKVDVIEGTPEVSFRMDPALLKRGLPLASQIAFGPKATMMSAKGFSYLVSTAGGAA